MVKVVMDKKRLMPFHIWTKIRRTKFSLNTIFFTKPKFRQLFLTDFCPIRYFKLLHFNYFNNLRKVYHPNADFSQKLSTQKHIWIKEEAIKGARNMKVVDEVDPWTAFK